MDKIKIRKGDFIASILLIAFGIFVVVASTRMPMKASYGGVESHWYVAPALFPLFTGSMLIILGGILLGIAIKDGGVAAFFTKSEKKDGFKVDTKTARALTVALAIGSFIYVFVKRVDFFVSIATFLFYLTTVFYPENTRVWKRLTIIFVSESLFFILFAATGWWQPVYDIYPYTFDMIALVAYGAMVISAWWIIRTDGEDTGKVLTTLLLSLITPLFLCPVFRYALRTPLPHEGIVMDYMNLGFYSIRKAIRGGA